jgi:hypothetical protein
MKKLIAIALISSLQSCAPSFMDMDPPGSPEFKAGWKDGCESGMATYGSMFNKMRYSFYQNYDLLSVPDYDAAWHESFNYCRHYNLKFLVHDLTTN